MIEAAESTGDSAVRPAERAAARRWVVTWPLAVVAAVLLAPRLVVTPFLPTPLLDDWLYELSVKRLLEHHQLWVSPLAVATLVGQIFWGAAFALPFGLSPAVLRISTLVASLAGAAALYLMCRQLGAGRSLAVAGSLAVWLHPVAFVLSWTFMTDVPFLALLCLSGWLFVRGASTGSERALALGSFFAGCAFLVRQQGALMPVAVVLWLALCRPEWFRLHARRMILAVIGPCLVAVAGYYALALAVGLPSMQATFFRTLLDAGPVAILNQAWRIAIIGLFFVAICFVPLIAGASRDLPATWRSSPRLARVVASGTLALMLIWAAAFALQHHGASFPFLRGGQMIRPDGFATDAYGERPDLLPIWVWLAIAVILAFVMWAGVLVIGIRFQLGVGEPPAGSPVAPCPNAGRGEHEGGHKSLLHDARSVRTPRAFASDQYRVPFLLGLFALVQFGGIIPAALYRPDLITYDRYLLPLFPFAVGLLVWALKGRTRSPAPVVAVLALLLVVNTLGMQDWLAYKRAEWQTDQWLTTTEGVPLNQVDGYGQWVGMHFYEATIFGPAQMPVAQPGAPWWLPEIAPALDPVYVVAAAPDVRAGYTVVAKRPYHSWIRPADHSWVYVLKREESP